jgi:hypothetical protein
MGRGHRARQWKAKCNLKRNREKVREEHGPSQPLFYYWAVRNGSRGAIEEKKAKKKEEEGKREKERKREREREKE